MFKMYGLRKKHCILETFYENTAGINMESSWLHIKYSYADCSNAKFIPFHSLYSGCPIVCFLHASSVKQMLKEHYLGVAGN